MAKLNEGSVIKKTAGDEIIATIPDVSVKADKTYVNTELGKKVNNTRVLTDVPSGAKFTDTVYTHPVSHPASMITESTTKRFVTDAEKTTWNAKETPTGAQTKATTAQTNAKTYTDTELAKKVDKVTGKELSTNDYTTAEKNKLSGIATGAQVNTVTSVSGKKGAVTLTKTDVGLGSVQNYGIATQTEANAGTSDAKYMTPLKTLGVVDAKIALSNSASKTDLTDHTGDVSNPHSVTKSQVGLGSVSNYSVATQTESEAGTSNAKYMTPLRTNQAITSLQAVKSVAGKTGAVTVTKSDVGLGNVTNVAQASKTDLTNHTGNGNNPHSVTKTHVGLSTVQNYGVATESEATVGTSNNKYMTPLRTKQAITSLQAVNSVAGKTGAVTVTKSDVGLSSVTNVAQASKSEFNTHKAGYASHNHDGNNTPSISWDNIAEKPTILQQTYAKYLSAGTTLTIGDLSAGVYLATSERGTAGGAAYILIDGVNSILKLHGAEQQGVYSYSGNSLIFKAHGGGGESIRIYKIY